MPAHKRKRAIAGVMEEVADKLLRSVRRTHHLGHCECVTSWGWDTLGVTLGRGLGRGKVGVMTRWPTRSCAASAEPTTSIL